MQPSGHQSEAIDEGRPDARSAAVARPPIIGRHTAKVEPTRRHPHAIALSIALHVVVGAVMLRLILIPLPLDSVFDRGDEASIKPERISFLALPRAADPATPPTPGRSGGNGIPESRRDVPPPAPLTAPTGVPSTLPPPAASAEPPEVRGTGAVVGEGGPLKGVQPSYSDARVWVPAAPVVTAPKSAGQRMDSAVVAMIRQYSDSVAGVTHEPNKFERGDWTIEKGGQKWGIDQKFIRLGKVSIPTAVLALLPLNRQGNPVAAERSRSLAMQRTEILEHANAAMNEAELRARVRALRERKERERRESAPKGAVPDGRP